MPRPAFKPDPDQRRILATLRRVADQQSTLDRYLTDLIGTAGASGVPVSVIADTLHVERKTIYRRMGRPM